MCIVEFLEIFFLDIFLGGVGRRFSYGFEGGGTIMRTKGTFCTHDKPQRL